MRRASAPAYDRFKTVVAVILVVILLLMLLRGCATTVPPAAPAGLAPPASATFPPPASSPATETLPAANPTASPTSTALPPTLTPTATLAAAEPTLTPTAAAAEVPTLTPAPAADSGSNASCNTVAPSRLSAGQKARVIQRLNVRSAASITASIVKVNSTNTQVEIIGGPTCEPVGGHAYLWWQIRLADGTEGWSAESPLNSAGYFLEPAS